MNVTPDQIRAARALLHLPQDELARRAHVSVVTIRRLENEVSARQVTPIVIDGVCRALEQAGAEFIPHGVRRRNTPRAQADRLFADLRAISLRSAERLKGHDILTDHDLYDEDGLPA